MYPKSDKLNWTAMADSEIVHKIGGYLKQMRLNRNMTQKRLAEISGVNRVSISRIENGRVATLLTFVQLLRALDRLDVLNAINEEARISPLQMLKLQKSRRERASTSRHKHSPAAGDEPGD